MGQKEVNPEPPAMDLITQAFATAICDVLGTELTRIQAVLNVLVQKGFISPPELQEAFESIAQIPPELAAEISNSMLQNMRARFA
jgi:hypothetical protein